MTMLNTEKHVFSNIQLKQSQNKVLKRLSLCEQHTSQCWMTGGWRLDRFVTIIGLRFLHLLLFVLIFAKLKTGPRPTLFSGELLLNAHL